MRSGLQQPYEEATLTQIKFNHNGEVVVSAKRGTQFKIQYINLRDFFDHDSLDRAGGVL